ncbi:hypothetical protein C1645_830636 [Glomus cerebriforme]|uniref:Uncharacterized protein n=1 Tax=Glomus cerebriforme TaxID=658196 RepID=A0A397SKZ7_9GLOM|nr:hypothetical protein C1645_830636 [Glomus cerebriforme]
MKYSIITLNFFILLTFLFATTFSQKVDVQQIDGFPLKVKKVDNKLIADITWHGNLENEDVFSKNRTSFDQV